mgnify:CR=1 FL=1
MRRSGASAIRSSSRPAPHSGPASRHCSIPALQLNSICSWKSPNVRSPTRSALRPGLTERPPRPATDCARAGIREVPAAEILAIEQADRRVPTSAHACARVRRVRRASSREFHRVRSCASHEDVSAKPPFKSCRRPARPSSSFGDTKRMPPFTSSAVGSSRAYPSG